MRSLPQSFHHPVYLAWTVLELISKQQSYCSTQNAAFGCNNPQALRTAWGSSCSEAVALSLSLDPFMQTQFSTEWNIFYIDFLKVTTAKIVQHYPFIQELCLAACRDLPPHGPHLCSKKRVDAPFSSLWKFSCKLLECYQHRQESSQSQFLCTQTKAPVNCELAQFTRSALQKFLRLLQKVCFQKNSIYAFIFCFYVFASYTIMRNMQSYQLFHDLF